MFFRVAGHTYAKIGLYPIHNIFFNIAALVQADHLFYQVFGIAVPVGVGGEEFLIGSGITAQGQYILHAKEVQVYQCILRFFPAKAPAYQVRYSLYFVLVHQGSANAHGTRPFADLYAFKTAIWPFFINLFGTVVGDVDKGRLEFHQGVQLLVYRFYAFSFGWGQYLQRNYWFCCLCNVFGDLHISRKSIIFLIVPQFALGLYICHMFGALSYFCLKHRALKIHTKGLIKRYRKRTVVNNVSFEVNQGEIVGLLGPNGAGKTTSFYMVVGLVKPDEGEVFLDDTNVTKYPMYKRAQMGVGYLPQEASVFRKLSVEDNIMAVLEMTRLSKQEQKDKLESLLDEFGLAHVRKNPGDVLSGGERRRTEIARALAVDPKFILLDEPFAGIDPIAVEDIQIIVAKLKYKNIGILITDHNVQETLSITDRAYLLFEGKILKSGTAEELAQDEQVRKVYLGQSFELKRKDYSNIGQSKGNL